jgi:hypothetical protein
MTYNFDPDKWYAHELAALKSGRRSGDLSQRAFQAAVEKLDRRLEEMWRRLDGTYQISNRILPQ